MLQYVTRKRRSDLPQLDHQDCYDEFDGSIPTGKIAKSLYPLKYLELTEKPKKISSVDENIISVENNKPTLIIVEHSYGVNIFEYVDDFSISDYKIEVEKKYWNGFIKNIEIK